MPRAARSSADVLERTRRESRRSGSGPSFAAPTRSSSRRRASARGGEPEEEAAVFRQSLSERSLSSRSPSTPAASRRRLRRSHSDLLRSSPEVPENDRRRAEEAFLAQREEAIQHKRRAEQAASRASPTPDVPDDERERAEAEFLAERERVLNDRKRFEELAASQSPSSQSSLSISPRASATASPAISAGTHTHQPGDDQPSDPVTEEDIALVVGADGEPLLPPGSPPVSREDEHPTNSDEVSCEEVLLVYYAHFEPSFATEEKVRKITQMFRARSEKLGEPELFREKMFGSIAAQRDVHPLEFFQAQRKASAKQQGRSQDKDKDMDKNKKPDKTPDKRTQQPNAKPNAKRGFRGRLGWKSKKDARAANRTQTAALSPAVEIEAASPFSPRKSLSRTPPSSPPTSDQHGDTSPLVPVNFNSRPPDDVIKSAKVEYHTAVNAMDRATAAVRIQAACRGHLVRAEIERIASAPSTGALSLVNPELSPISDGSVGVDDHHESSSRSETSPSEESDDVALLMEFYRKVEPGFANQQKVERIIERFRSRETARGESWRDLMYEAITKQRGIDPRDAAGVASIPLDDATASEESASTTAASPGARSLAVSGVRTWSEQRSAVLLDLKSVTLACAQSRLWWARVLQSMASLDVAFPGRLSPIGVRVANALSMAVVARAAQSLSNECRREILSLRELKRIDGSAHGSSSKRQQHYDDIEAAKVMRQVRTEVGVLTKEMNASYQQIKKFSLQQIFESLGRPSDVRRRLQSQCAAAVDSSALVAQLQLEKRFNWALNDGDCVALMEDLLIRVEQMKEERESVQLGRCESAMMGARRAASMGKGMYEIHRDTAVRCHPGCLSDWVGAVATGERVRVVKVVSDNSGMLFAKVDEDGLMGWIALGARPSDDVKPVMKRVPQSPAQPVLGTPPSRASSSADDSPSDQPRKAAKNGDSREPQKRPSNKLSGQGVGSADSRRDASTGPASVRRSTQTVPKSESPAASPQPGGDAGSDRWARESTQAQRLATLRHELGREAMSSPGTRSLEDKLHALEAQLGTLTSDLQLDSGGIDRRHSREKMRASWSPNATTGSPHKAHDATDATQARQQVQASSPADGAIGLRCIEESWDTQDVADWLGSIGLGEYAPAFSTNSMDGEAMVELERWRRRAYDGAQGGNEGSLFADCLRGLGVAKTGHILKLCRNLAKSARAVAA